MAKDVSFGKEWGDFAPEERGGSPAMDEFWEWLENLDAIPKSKLGRDAEYAVKQRSGITEVLKDGRLDFSNNKPERIIKELVMGRKNWLFSTSLKGIHSNGVILSSMKTEELQGLDARRYLNYLFTEITKLGISCRGRLRSN